jgi:hypothetical protein
MYAHYADNETAFLVACLHEVIDMRYAKGVKDGTPRVERLLKGIYGLKHASREWYILRHHTLTSLFLQRSTPCT